MALTAKAQGVFIPCVPVALKPFTRLGTHSTRSAPRYDATSVPFLPDLTVSSILETPACWIIHQDNPLSSEREAECLTTRQIRQTVDAPPKNRFTVTAVLIHFDKKDKRNTYETF